MTLGIFLVTQKQGGVLSAILEVLMMKKNYKYIFKIF
jgi:hypothetical protein